jgi:SAM-dependent methyltransferase
LEHSNEQRADYTKRLADEERHFSAITEVHALPPIAQYWAHKYVRPMLVEFGFNLPEELFAKYIAISSRGSTASPLFVSLGAGNCDTEVRTALLLLEAGLTNSVIECVELNPRMLERGRELAARAGVRDNLAFTQGDLNRWKAEKPYTAVLANQSLHHVLDLEHLFAEVKGALDPSGFFVVTDMIGRNGHQRWPEAIEALLPFWRELPVEYRWNRLLNRYEEEYIDHDCSSEGFEGIRAQDILPLLLTQFDFELFVGFGSIIDVFVDRSFGFNFDGLGDWDRAFIDRVHAFDERAILDGLLTPTHMIAAMTPAPTARRHLARGLAPERCVRRERQPTPRGVLEVTTPALHPTEPGGRFYSIRLAASGGTPPYRWSASDLPPGLTVNSDGELLGSISPNVTGTPLITVMDSSSSARHASQRYTILLKPSDGAVPLTLLDSVALGNGTAGLGYAELLSAGGGCPPLRWSLVGGALPQGLGLDPARGVISGQPLAASISAFDVRVSDALGRSDVSHLKLRIDPTEGALTRVGVVPHLAFGGGWGSSILLINQSPVRATCAVALRSSRGRRANWPLDPPPTGCECHEAGHYILPPHASLHISVAPNEKEEISCWAEVFSTAPVLGHVTYSYITPNGARSEVTIAFDPTGSPQRSIPFDNEKGNQTGLALLNLSNANSDALVTAFWSSDGDLIGESTIPLNSECHEAFMVPARFPFTAQWRGTVVVRSLSGGAVSAIGLRMNGAGLFSNLPVHASNYSADARHRNE